MNTFMEEASSLADSCKRVKNNKVYETLAIKFNIGKRTAADRFKSLFGMPVREYITNNITPSRELMIDSIVKSQSFEECYKLCGYNDMSGMSKLFEKYFLQSNYFKVKRDLIAKIPNHNYTVTREDNESILISQLIGDGHFERGNTLAIEHCEKQYEYLRFKVGLLNKAYPTTNGLEAIRTMCRSFGTTYKYRSSACLEKQISKLSSRTLQNNVSHLTPFGVCLYFMDDGYLTHNTEYGTWELGLSSINMELRDCLIEYFTTYGFKFNNSNKSAITLQKSIEVIKFIKEFIEPYDSILPECVKYKYNYKDIVGNVEG